MLWCKPGTFMRGSPEDEKDREEDEEDRGFYETYGVSRIPLPAEHGAGWL